VAACTSLLPAIAFNTAGPIHPAKVALLVETVCHYFVEDGPTLDEWITNTGEGWVRSCTTHHTWFTGCLCFYFKY